MARKADDTVSRSPATAFGGVALRGAAQTGLSQAVQVTCQILSVILLARLLVPEDFGLVAMCAPILGLMNVFKDFGLLQVVVQKKDLTFGQLNTLFWINTLITVTAALVLIVLSPLAAEFYGDARVVPLLMAFALPTLAAGFSAQPTALLNRQMRFGILSLITAVQALTMLGVAFAWALVAPSYWALFGGYFASTLVAMAISWGVCGWRPDKPGGAAGVRGLLGFGASVTGFNLANFFSRNLDNVLIGRFWGSVELGLYDRSYKLLLFPLQQVATPLGRVMIPILSRFQDQPERYRSAFFRVLNLMHLMLLPGIAALVVLADTAIPFLLGARFAEAAPIFAALGIAGLVQVSSNASGWLFISQGRARDMMYWGVVSGLITVGAICVGVYFGTIYVAIGVSVASFAKLIPLWWVIGRRGPITVGAAIRFGFPALLAGFVCLAVVWVAAPVLPEAALWKLVSGTVLSYAVYGAVSLASPVGRGALQDARLILAGQVRQIPQ